MYVGLDIPSKRISLCVLNEAGQVVHRSQVWTIDQMMRILEGLPDRFEVCYEASCGYGHFHDLLRPVAARVLVARRQQKGAAGLKQLKIDTPKNVRFHVKIESGTQVASRGPTWRIATPPV